MELGESLRAEQGADTTLGTRAGMDLEAALEQLSDTARAVVWLHDVEGYTHAEIGELMGMSASFPQSQLSRAHRRLRHMLVDGDSIAGDRDAGSA